MQINVTFLIQVINFYITYRLLDVILLKPLVSLLQKRDAVKDRLVKEIEEKEQELHSVEYQKEVDLQEFQIRLQQKYVLPQHVPQEVPLCINYQQNEEAIGLLVKQGSELLLKEVSHACKS